jgi:hypothetical protein
MNIVLQQHNSPSYSKQSSHQPVWRRFISWCGGQEKNRFGWLAAGLAGHGCFLTPLTLFAIMVSGNSMLLWALVIGAMTMSLVTSLAALSTKITLPALFLSILIDTGIVISCIAGSIAT